MASLSDFLPQGPSTPGSLMDFVTQQRAGAATTDNALSQTLLKRQYETRTLPDIVNRQAGRGAFFSTATQTLGDHAREDYLNQSNQGQVQLSRTLADLARNRILASLGVSI